MNRYSILLVDDEEDQKTHLITAFQDEGFRTLTASGVDEAIRRIQTEKPVFLILDPDSRNTNGMDLLESIQKTPPPFQMIIIILSRRGDLDSKLQFLSEGAHEVLLKPVDPREVTARVHRFIRMITEFRSFSTPQGDQKYQMPAPAPDDRSQGTVDVVAPTLDSFARIRPQYGAYRVEQLVGSGGMGYVFKAYEESLDRFVAVKILSRKLSSSPSFVLRFRHEAKILASLNHPGIAFIYSFGEEEGEHYFAMQWCPGGSLNDLIRKKGRLELLPSVEIILRCAQALQAAAAKGVVHRDIKPTNLLFDENQHIKIVDFGLASAEKKSSARITQAQEFLGTPTFMAPEQAQSSLVDHRADIYSLGITFYYMLFGKYPFEATSGIEMLIKHATEPFPAYEQLQGRIPRAVYNVIARMTQKNADDRYGSYQDLITDVEHLRNDLLRQSQWKIPRLRSLGTAPAVVSSNLFDTLSALYAQSASGILHLRWSALNKSFLVRQREIVLYESNQPDESVWQELVRRKRLEPSQAPPRNEDLEKAINTLLLKNVVSVEDLKSAYLNTMRSALMQVFLWPDLSCEFQYGTIDHDAFASVRIEHVLLEAARNQLSAEDVSHRVPPDVLFSRTAQFDTILASLDLKPEESFIAYRIEGPETSQHTLHLLTGLSVEKIGRLACALEPMGAIQFQAGEEKRGPKRHIPQPPSYREPRISQPTHSDPKTPVAEESLATPNPRTQPAEQVRMELQKSDKKIEVEHHLKVAEQFYRMAQEKFQELDYWKVTELCKQAIRHAPQDARYYHLMAVAYARHPRFGKDAEQCFYKAIETDPWNPEYHLDLARFYLHQGLPSRAITQCEKALKIAPEHIEGKLLLGELANRK